MTDAERWKRRVSEEKKKNNKWIQCNGQVVIFYPPALSKSDIEAGKLEKMYTPKAIGFTEAIIILLFDNNIQLMLPTERCVIVDPAASALMCPENNPIYNGIEVNNVYFEMSDGTLEDEHIQSILYDAYANNWLESPIITDKTKENDDEQ